MKFKIDPKVFETFPTLVVGLPIIMDFDNSKSASESVNFLRQQEIDLKEKFTPESLIQDNRVIAYQRAFRKFGVDPLISLPAHVALSKRVVEGGFLPDINPLVNLYNAFSIKYLTPFGGENLDAVYGDFILKFANGGEKWIPIGGSKSKPAVAGELIWTDDLDVSTKALNWRQCDRTKLTADSKNGYFVMDGFTDVNLDNIKLAAADFTKMATQLFGGQAYIYWLDIDHPEVEVHFESKKIADIDSQKVIAPKAKPVSAPKTLSPLAISLSDAIKKLVPSDIVFDVDHPSNPSFGDYSTNVAMILGKAQHTNPLEIANAIKTELDKKLPPHVTKIDVLPPGFINFWLDTDYLISETKKIKSGEYQEDLNKIGSEKTMVIDYSAPNIAKPFGIGHLRSTNIGQAIYNIYKLLGWKTIGDNHLGDWGTQFGKMIYQIQKEQKEHNLNLGDLSIDKLEQLYVQFHKDAETDPTLEEKARHIFKKLEEKDPEITKIWQLCIDISLREFDRIYQLLKVKLDYAYGESYYRELMPTVLADAKAKNLLVESQGAQVINLPGAKVPAMLVKSDGGTTYHLRDLATIKFRVQTWNPDLIIYEVGADHKLHFQQVFQAAGMLGYIDRSKLVHIAHGMIRWSDGKFSTRQGKTIHLEEVINEAISRAEKLVKADVNKKEIAQVVGIGAIKFNDLKQEPERDIVFDWDKLLALDGYSAPYLLYTYSRCQSVLAKAKTTSLEAPSQMAPEEITLIRSFYLFPEVIIRSASDMSPHHLTQYLFDLAQKYSLFYEKCRIIGEPQPVESFRLFLTATTVSVLKTGLNLLGIEVLEKM